jgi:transposase
MNIMKKASTIKVFQDCLGIGIDVSKAELAVVGMTLDEPYLKCIRNEMQAIKAFIRRLHQGGYRGKIVCESTGHYHLKLALVCHEVGVELIVLNPLQSSKHSKAKIRKTKTDPQDALTLATMCLTEPKLPQPMQLTLSKALIRLKMGQLAAVEKQLQQFRQSLAQYEETYAELGLALSDFQRALREHGNCLKRLRKQLENELEGLLAQALADDDRLAELREIPGYSNVVAGLVGSLDRQVKGADSWTAFVGLDVSVRQSGKWTGHGKLTKRGNAYMRKRLFQAAWGACLNYDYVRAYYDRLKMQGRKHAEAVCMIARKLLRIAYHVVTKNIQFDPNIAFSEH